MPIPTDVMKSTLVGHLRRLRAEHGARLVRYGAVSAFNVVFGQVFLYLAQVVAGMSPVTANVWAVSIGSIPAYVLSRNWVWEKRGKSHFMREVVPFWSLALIGFAVSTSAVWWVDARLSSSPVVINITNLIAFGVVWIAKFFVLDRVLFKPEEAPAV